MNSNQLKVLNYLAIPLLVAMAVASYAGIFFPETYERETASFAVQGIGQDIVNLFVGAPVLIVSLILMNKGNKIASFIFGGTIFYYFYSYIIYTFGVHYNNYFLLYCFILALSTYSLILFIYFNSGMDIQTWFKKEPPTRSTAIFIIVIAAMFYMLWLKDIVPPLIHGKAPLSVIENDYIINPVHAIDLAFALPGLIITSVLLFKKHELGYILAPIILVFIIMLTIALIGMVVMLQIRKITDDISIAIVFVGIASISIVFLRQFLIKTIR